MSGSIGSPAESANLGMLAVGATHYWDTHTIASYSSQGPTPDGRVKPDIVGTACAETVSYQPREGSRCWFGGTSQASPHVAGMAALVKQRFDEFTPVQIADYLIEHAEERGTSGPDNTWGYGFAVLPPPDAGPGPGPGPGPAPGGCDIADVATDGSAVAGAWDNGCQSEVTDDRNARYYKFTLDAAAEVTITLKADAAEPVLHLREGESKTGTELDSNDGIGPDYKQAKIERSLEAGTYTIEARTYNAGYEGPFTLTVSVAGGTGGPPSGGCDIADVATDGSEVAGSWANDCQSEVTDDRNARYYKFTLDAAVEVTITLKADAAEPVLHLREGESKTGTEIAKHEGFQAEGYKSAQIVEALEAGTYTIEARTYSENYEGAFTLTVMATN